MQYPNIILFNAPALQLGVLFDGPWRPSLCQRTDVAFVDDSLCMRRRSFCLPREEFRPVPLDLLHVGGNAASNGVAVTVDLGGGCTPAASGVPVDSL